MSKNYLEKFDEETKRLQKQWMREGLWFHKYKLFRKEHPELEGKERMVAFLEENNIPPTTDFYKNMMFVADKMYGDKK